MPAETLDVARRRERVTARRRHDVGVIADDELFRERVVRAFTADGGYRVRVLPDEGRRGTPPAAVVLACDVAASAALEAVERAREVGPPVVVVPAASGAALAALLRAGAHGVVLAHTIETSLVPTVGAVIAGQVVVPPAGRSHLEAPTLSPREKQVLGLVVLGFTNTAIAAQLHLSEATVKSHLGASFRKLGVRSRSEAAAVILDPQGGLGIGILSLVPADEALDVFHNLEES